MSFASAAEALLRLAAAKAVIAACNFDGKSFNQSFCELRTRAVINLLYSCAGDLLINYSFLLGKALSVDQADCLIFIHGEDDGFAGCAGGLRNKCFRFR